MLGGWIKLFFSIAFSHFQQGISANHPNNKKQSTCKTEHLLCFKKANTTKWLFETEKQRPAKLTSESIVRGR